MVRRMRVYLLVLVLLAFPCVALAEDSEQVSPGNTVWETYDSQSINGNMMYDTVFLDLASRYYNSPNPDNIKPIRVNPDFEGAARPLDDFVTYEQFFTYWSLNWGQLSVYGQSPYELFTQDGLSTWKTTDPDAKEQYLDWYNYFEDWHPSSGGGGSGSYEFVDCTSIYMPLEGVSAPSAYPPYFTVGGTKLTFYTVYASREGYALFPQTIRVNIPDIYYANIADVSNYNLAVSVRAIQNDRLQVTLLLMEDGYTYNDFTWGGVTYHDSVSFNGSASIVTVSTSDYSSGTINLPSNYRFDTPSNNRSIAFGNYPGFASYDGANTGGGGESDDTPVFPPQPDPDPQPEPGNPPSGPSITLGDFSPTINSNNQTTNTTADLQPILDALRIINDNIIAYGDDIRNDLHEFKELFDGWMRSFYEQLEYWFDQLKQALTIANTHLTKCERYLRDIFYKMGSGTGSRPDITNDPEETGSWWDYILKRLLALLPSSVLRFLDLFQSLQYVFPFSVPWDIGTLLAFFAAEPVTPVFQLYLGTWTADVNLRDWNATAQVVRQCITIYFAMQLLMYTPHAMKVVKVM